MRHGDIKIGVRVIFNDGSSAIEEGYITKIYPGSYIRLAVPKPKGRGWNTRLAIRSELTLYESISPEG